MSENNEEIREDLKEDLTEDQRETPDTIEYEEQPLSEEAAAFFEELEKPSEPSGPYRTPEDEALAARIEARRKAIRRKSRRRKRLIIIGIIVLLLVLLTMCGREIVKLKAENLRLQQQQQALIEERDQLQKELEKVDDPEYIKDQARKQLRLLDPGEILFLFGDDEASEENADDKN